MSAQVQPSEHDGKSILYVDPVGIAHTGIVIGQSGDGWLYVQSDRENVAPVEWHFRIRAETLPGVLA
jgi:hypothetical protein